MVKKITITVVIIVSILILWQYLEYRKANSRILPEVRLQEVDFHDSPQLKKLIYDMATEMNPETKENPIYIVSIFNTTGPLPILFSNKEEWRLKIVINWYKNIYFCRYGLSGYFVEGNSVFIVGYSIIPLHIVSPGKSWRTFKSQTAYPLFGKNIKRDYSYIIDYKIDPTRFSAENDSARMVFDEKTARRYRDSISLLVKSTDEDIDSILSSYGVVDRGYRMP